MQPWLHFGLGKGQQKETIFRRAQPQNSCPACLALLVRHFIPGGKCRQVMDEGVGQSYWVGGWGNQGAVLFCFVFAGSQAHIVISPVALCWVVVGGEGPIVVSHRGD